MLDLTKIEDLLPNILKYLSYEYHILFLKFLDSDNTLILNEQRSYIFCQLLLPNNLIDFEYTLNLKQIVSPKTRIKNYFHEQKLQFLLIKNNKHQIIKHIYEKYPIDYKHINYILEQPYICEYLTNNKIIEKKFLKNNYIKYVKYDINKPEYNIFTKHKIFLKIDEHFFNVNTEDSPLINIFLDYSYNLMYGLNRISYQNLIIKYNKEFKYKWLKSDTLRHIQNKNELVISWLKINKKYI